MNPVSFNQSLWGIYHTPELCFKSLKMFEKAVYLSPQETMCDAHGFCVQNQKCVIVLKTALVYIFLNTLLGAVLRTSDPEPVFRTLDVELVSKGRSSNCWWKTAPPPPSKIEVLVWMLVLDPEQPPPLLFFFILGSEIKVPKKEISTACGDYLTRRLMFHFESHPSKSVI